MPEVDLSSLAMLSAAERQAFLESTPADSPPDNVEPNFDNPPNLNAVSYAVVALALAAVLFTGVLRLYCSLFVTRLFRMEDYLGTFGYLPFLATVILQLYITAGIGFLADQWNFTLGRYLEHLLELFVARLVYFMSMLVMKTAIMREWIRIFVPKRQRKGWFFWVSMAMIVLNVSLNGVGIIMICISCVPTRKIWQPWIDGTCINQNRRIFDVLTACVNLVLDLAILLLPQPIIWRLNMPLKRRLGVSTVFSVGLVVVACAIGRLHTIATLDYEHNVTHGSTLSLIWGFGETATVILVYTMPSIPKAFSRSTGFGSIIYSLRVWTGSVFGRPKQNAGRSTKLETIGGTGGLRRTATTAEMDLMDTRDDKYVELRDDNYAKRIQAPENGILKTTHVHMEVENVSEPMVNAEHPWVIGMIGEQPKVQR